MSAIPNYSFTKRNICPLCRSCDLKSYIDFKEIPVCQCKNCDFIFSSLIMSAETLNSYYKESFGGLRHLQGQDVNSRVNFEALNTIIDFSKVHSFLDIGTGYGLFLSRLRRRYHHIDVKGVELSEQEAEYAINTLGLDVSPTSLAQSAFKKESFDVVSSFEVIEHIENPIPFIVEITDYLKPKGFLVIMTDNFTSDVVVKMGAEFPKWIPHTHISHFSSNTLLRTIENLQGLKIIKTISYTPWDLFLRRILMFNRLPKPPDKCFNLQECLTSEMIKEYKLFWLRKILNPLWFSLTSRDNLNGAIMYIVAQKL